MKAYASISFEFSIVVLGLGFRSRLNWTETEAMDDINRRIEEISEDL